MILSNLNVHALTSPLKELEKAYQNGNDIFNLDGGHPNDIGNKIYGTEIGKKLINLIK